MIGLGTRVQARTKLLSEFASLLVAGRAVGCGDHAANIAQIDCLNPGHCSFGPITPFGGLQGRRELFGERNKRAPLDLWHALSRSQLVHLVDGLTNAGHTASQDFLGQLVLRVGQCVKRCLAMASRRTKPWRLGTGWWLRALATRAIGRTPVLAIAVATTAASTAIVAITPTASTTTPIVTITPTASTTTTPVAIATTTPALRRKHLGDQRLVSAAAKEFKPFRFLAGPLRGEDGGDRQTLKVRFGLDLHDIAHQ